MKKIVLALTVALLGTFMMNSQPPRHSGKDRGQSVEKRVERLDKVLSLTEAQKAEITRIYTEEMESVMSQSSPDGVMTVDGKVKPDREKIQARRDAVNARVKALLTPEQAAKFDKMRERHGKRGHGNRHAGPQDRKAPRPEGCQGNCQCKGD